MVEIEGPSDEVIRLVLLIKDARYIQDKLLFHLSDASQWGSPEFEALMNRAAEILTELEHHEQNLTNIIPAG